MKVNINYWEEYFRDLKSTKEKMLEKLELPPLVFSMSDELPILSSTNKIRFDTETINKIRDILGDN